MTSPDGSLTPLPILTSLPVWSLSFTTTTESFTCSYTCLAVNASADCGNAAIKARRRNHNLQETANRDRIALLPIAAASRFAANNTLCSICTKKYGCLLYTSDAADEEDS